MKSGFGFTLIELLVSVTISAILFGGGIAAYRGIGEKQTLKQAGADFQSNLRLFQQKAMASEKPIECGTNKFDGFNVSAAANSSDYSAKVLCAGATPPVNSFVLPEGITFTEAFNITFQVLKAEVLNAKTIVLFNGTLNYQVIVESGGVIRGGLL